MQTINLALIAAGVVIVALMFSRGARLLAVAFILILLLGAAVKAFVRVESCTLSGGACVVMPAWAGICSPMNGAAVLKVDGTLYLMADGTEAQARCLDVRVWR